MSSMVTNKIKIIGDQAQIDDLLEKIRVDGEVLGSIDFNKIIPMPETLNRESGSLSFETSLSYLKAVCPDTEDYGIEKMNKKEYEKLVQDLNKKEGPGYTQENIMLALDDDNSIEEGKVYIYNFINYGATTWYKWCIENWYTKWNAYYLTPVRDNTIEFCTANDHPFLVITKLAEMYPDLRFNCEWADEMIGLNVGRKSISDNWLYSIHIPEDKTKEAYEMSAEILGINLEEEGYCYDEEKGTYVRKIHGW